MDQKIKAEWVAALRSGEYHQGRGALVREGFEAQSLNYCCLGVLCELSPVVELVVQTIPDEDSYFRYRSTANHLDTDGSVLPLAARFWAELDDEGGELPIVDRTGYNVNLPILNDDAKLSFDQIADVIEYFL